MDIQTLADLATGTATILGVLGSGYLAVRKLEDSIRKSSNKSITEAKSLSDKLDSKFIQLQQFNGERYREINQGLYELKQKYEQDLVRLGETDKELESIITNLKTYVDKRFDELVRLVEAVRHDRKQ